MECFKTVCKQVYPSRTNCPQYLIFYYKTPIICMCNISEMSNDNEDMREGWAGSMPESADVGGNGC